MIHSELINRRIGITKKYYRFTQKVLSISVEANIPARMKVLFVKINVVSFVCQCNIFLLSLRHTLGQKGSVKCADNAVSVFFLQSYF